MSTVAFWMLVFAVALLPMAVMVLAFPYVQLALRSWRRLGRYFETGTPWYDDVLRTVADELGLPFRPRRFLAPPEARGQLDGVMVRLQLDPYRVVDQEVLEVRLVVAGLPQQVRFWRRSNPVSSRGQRSGDALFDQGVVFEAPRTPGQSWLRVQTRLAVQEVVQAGGQLQRGILVLTHGGPDLVGAAEVVRLTRQALRVARDLRQGPADLRSIASSDPEPATRLWALDELAREGELDTAWLRELARSRDDRVAVRAATLASDEERLRELLAGPSAREALLALAPVLTDDDDVEDLIRRLIRERPDTGVLQLAARLCTVAAVVDLLAVTGTHRPAARTAVAAIQARAIGERGGLAMVESGLGAGELSLAEPKGAGTLSEPDASPVDPRRGRLAAKEGR
ncbi:MAG: hypothetical protein H6738_21890 [Alphaproteobacteria bacterium]|nr:hypothetical protein [Alphaproteobacteria bacterium]MCB9699450.1 hypothetical protein [Alphaproteobacteria bacterium]